MIMYGCGCNGTAGLGSPFPASPVGQPPYLLIALAAIGVFGFWAKDSAERPRTNPRRKGRKGRRR